jgi:signal transduction histidine kinase
VSARLRAFLFSFQTKLVLAMTGVIVIALLFAGAIYVARDRSNSKERALDRVAASSPLIYQEAFKALDPRTRDVDQPFSETLNTIARDQDVRILVVTSDSVVLYDTSGDLGGSTVEVPASEYDDYQRGFLSWEAPSGFPEPDLTFVSAASAFIGVGVRGNEIVPFRIILAVESNTIAESWQEVLPSLALAGVLGILLSTLFAVLLARQVSQPVRKLTLASEAMAHGDFSQRVDVDRNDELGRLARAFTSMSQRVGERDQQMRALLANVSHDLKTPMTSITGYAQALADGTASLEDARRIGEVLGEEASHVNALLSDLLYLGEIDAGQVITRRETVPLDEVVGRCVRRIEPVARAKEIEVGVDLEPGLTLQNADPDKLERAITNVLDNAAKFTPEDGEISVIARHENGPGSPIVCSVTNSGSSIPEDDLPRIFDRFFRSDRARRTASGSGLGLAIARQLVELNGGTIHAENEPAGGVSFTLSFAG